MSFSVTEQKTTSESFYLSINLFHKYKKIIFLYIIIYICKLLKNIYTLYYFIHYSLFYYNLIYFPYFFIVYLPIMTPQTPPIVTGSSKKIIPAIEIGNLFKAPTIL